MKKVEKQVTRAIITLSNLHITYTNATAAQKREIISSVFPEKLVPEKNGYRTFKVNKAARLIYLINNALPKNTNGKDDEISHLSHNVTHRGIERHRPPGPVSTVKGRVR